MLFEEVSENILRKLEVEEFLMTLPEMEREIIWLSEVEGYTGEEIGEIVGPKYRGHRMAGSTIHYYREKVKKAFRRYFEA